MGMVAAATILQSECERLGVTPRQLAQALGLHERTIARWLMGTFQPHPVWLSRIASMKKEDFDAIRDSASATGHTVDASLHLERSSVSKVSE
jgi:hypothetical protein